MFNLENKLIYYVIRPFLNKHYDSQKRDRIVEERSKPQAHHRPAVFAAV